MMWALMARQLRHQRWLLLSLVGGLTLLEVAIIRVAASIEAGPGLDPLLEMLPSMLRPMIDERIRTATFPAATAFGFQHPASLLACLSWVLVLASLPAADREAGLLDLLLARPLPRSTYMASVLACVAVGAVLLPAALLLGCWAGLALVDAPGELPWFRYLPSASALFTLMLALGGFTLWVAAGVRRRGVAVARAVGVIVTLYVVDMLSVLWPALSWLAWLSPFHYFGPINAALIPHTPMSHPLVLLGIFFGFTRLALARFERRDA